MAKRINLNKILSRQAEWEQQRKDLIRRAKRAKKKGFQSWVKTAKKEKY